MPRIGPKLVVALVCSFAFAMPAATLGPSTAGAAEGGSSTVVVGRGDILTKILTAARQRKSNTRATKAKSKVSSQKKVSTRSTTRTQTAPACREIRLNDGEIEMLVVKLGHAAPTADLRALAELFNEHLLTAPADSTPVEEFDILARQCGQDLVSIWAVPRKDDTDIVGRLSRSMLTRLPEPVVIQSPPADLPVPVNQPVFVSINPDNWRRVATTLRVGGIIADVRADPIAVRTYTGEPQTRFVVCEGSGRRFNATSTLSARAQAAAEGACIMRYRHASPRADPVLAPWLGSVSVLWRAEWRVNGGPWRSLGIIPRTRLIERSTIELRTSITRTVSPTRAATRRSSSDCPGQAHRVCR